MHKRSSTKKQTGDLNQLAASIVDTATEVDQVLDQATTGVPEKNPHAAALGRLGGLKGGRARAQKLSAERRSEIAQKAAEARWQKERSDEETG